MKTNKVLFNIRTKFEYLFCSNEIVNSNSSLKERTKIKKKKKVRIV